MVESHETIINLKLNLKMELSNLLSKIIHTIIIFLIRFLRFGSRGVHETQIWVALIQVLEPLF